MEGHPTDAVGVPFIVASGTSLAYACLVAIYVKRGATKDQRLTLMSAAPDTRFTAHDELVVNVDHMDYTMVLHLEHFVLNPAVLQRFCCLIC